MKTGATVRLVRRAMLLFAFCGLSLAVIGWVSGNCPNYGTKSIRCPGAPDAYDNGPCNMSLDWLTGELKINGGRLGAHNINDLNPENGSTITANEYAKCYTEMKCTIGEEKYNGESDEDLHGLYGNAVEVDPVNNVVRFAKTTETTYNYFPSYSSGPCAG